MPWYTGDWFCPNCGHQGNRKRKVSGSFIVELLAWISGIVLAVFALWPAIFLPIVYSCWRLCSGTYICSNCKNPGMIPATSPMAQKIRAQLQQNCNNSEE